MDDARDGFNIAGFALTAHAMTILPFTRTGMGIRGLGAYGFWAMVMIFFYALLMGSPAMLLYLALWLVMAVRHRLFPDRRQHSAYQGYPWLFGWMVKDEYIARCVEAASMFLIGSLLYGLSQAVGLFVVCGTFSLGAKYVMEHSLHLRRVQAAHDWQAEADGWRVAMEEVQRRLRR